MLVFHSLQIGTSTIGKQYCTSCLITTRCSAVHYSIYYIQPSNYTDKIKVIYKTTNLAFLCVTLVLRGQQTARNLKDKKIFIVFFPMYIYCCFWTIFTCHRIWQKESKYWRSYTTLKKEHFILRHQSFTDLEILK